MTPKHHKAPGWFELLCGRLRIGWKKNESRQVLELLALRTRRRGELSAVDLQRLTRHALRRRLERLAA